MTAALLIHWLLLTGASPSLNCPVGSTLERRPGPDTSVLMLCVGASGQAQGPWAEIDESSFVRRTGFYRDGMDDGVWQTYDQWGVTSEMRFASGKREGEFFVRTPKTHRIARLGAYAADLPDGWWHWFSDAGQLLGTSLFVNGTGDMLLFDDLGRKRRVVRLVDGTARLEIKFDPNGREATRHVMTGERWIP